MSDADRDRRRTGRGRWLAGGLLAAGAVAASAVVALAALSHRGPAQHPARRFAHWIDSRVEGSSGPSTRGYARIVAPLLSRLYRRVADDLAAELAASRGGAGGAGKGAGAGAEEGGIHSFAILDIGCGPGDLAAMLAKRLPQVRVVGLDLSPSMVELARERHGAEGRLRFEAGDAASLPFEAQSFDLVVSTLSLHHWPDPGAAFGEMRRVLRPGGAAFIYDLTLLTLEAERLPDVASRAGLPASGLRLESLRGGPPASLFVRFRVDGTRDVPAADATLTAGAAGHARIPAAVTPGEVA